MTMRISAAILLPALAVLAGCSAETSREPQLRAPAAEVVGEPVSCIQTRNIRSSRVRDDFTIDFEMIGNQVFRNTLPNRCPSLGFEQRFAHSSTTATLCSVDTITVLDSNGRRGAGCGLGQFVPIRYSEPAGS